MIATATPPVVTVSAADKLKFRFENRIVWKHWDEMTPAMQDYVRGTYPSYAAEHAGAAEPGRYAEWIAYFEAQVERCRQLQYDVTASMAGRGTARANLEQYARAIANLREAELIPEDTVATFAAWPNELRTYVPPVLYPGNHEDSGPVIETLDNVVRLSDPIAIAWLRHLVRHPDQTGGEHIEERGQHEPAHPIVNPRTRQFVMWGDLAGYANYHESMTRRAPE